MTENGQDRLLRGLITAAGWNHRSGGIDGPSVCHLSIFLMSYRFPDFSKLQVVPELIQYEKQITRYVNEHPAPPHWYKDEKNNEWGLSAPTVPSTIYSTALVSADDIRRQKTVEQIHALKDVAMQDARTTIIELGKRILAYEGRPGAEMESIRKLFKNYASLDPYEVSDTFPALEEEMRQAVGQ